MAKSLFAVAAILSVASLACGGGSSSSTSCGTFTPCGGSVVGTWTISNECVSMPDAGASKPDSSCSTTSQSDIKMGGTVTFRSDGTYTANRTMSGSGTNTYSAGCLSGSLTCPYLDSTYNSPGTADAGTHGSCSSTSDGGPCTCSATFNINRPPETGTYTTSGNTLTTVPTSGANSPPSDYCVQGNTLVIRTSDTSDGQSAVITIIATK